MNLKTIALSFALKIERQLNICMLRRIIGARVIIILQYVSKENTGFADAPRRQLMNKDEIKEEEKEKDPISTCE